MQPALSVAMLGLTLGCLGGCGGSSATGALPTPTHPPSTAEHRGGFIGDLDAARLQAVCTNARQADEVLQQGVSPQTADAALAAIVELLQRPPADPAVQALAVPVQRDVTAKQRKKAVDAVLAFCARNDA